MDYQTSIDLGIYQGENRLVENNLLIDRLEIRIPPNLAGHESIDVTFTYDISEEEAREQMKAIIKKFQNAMFDY